MRYREDIFWYKNFLKYGTNLLTLNMNIYIFLFLNSIKKLLYPYITKTNITQFKQALYSILLICNKCNQINILITYDKVDIRNY